MNIMKSFCGNRLTKCHACGGPVANGAAKCPRCGAQFPGRSRTEWTVRIVAAIVAAIAVCFAMNELFKPLDEALDTSINATHLMNQMIQESLK